MLFVKNEEILARVDHTALKATATWQEIRTLCEEALEYHTASVCIPPSYVARAHAEFPGLNICTVIGFPLGYNMSFANNNNFGYSAAISWVVVIIIAVLSLIQLKTTKEDG